MKDLRLFHPSDGMQTASLTKAIAVLVIALIILGIGAYSYHTGLWHAQKTVVPDSALPSPAPPVISK